MGFWDTLRGIFDPGYATKRDKDAIRKGIQKRSGGSSSRSSTAKKATRSGTSLYTGGSFRNMPRNLMSDKAKREASNRAWGNRYAAQAKRAGVPMGPGTTGYQQTSGLKGPSGGGEMAGYDGFGDGSIEDILSQFGGQEYTPPTFEVPQIDVAATIAAMFDPQFAAIAKGEKSAKGEHKKSDANLKAAYGALANEIAKQGGKALDKQYKEAEGANVKDAKALTKNLSDAGSKQMKQDMEMAAALGIGSAIDSDSGGRKALNEGIADINKSAKSQNNRLEELKSVDKQINRDSVDVTKVSGQNRRAELSKQLQGILANYGERRVDTTVAKANKKADLEAQNQAAVNEANAQASADYNNWQKNQNDIMKQAIGVQMDRAKMQNDLDIQGLKNENSRYSADSRVDIAGINAASRGSSSKDKDLTAKQQLINSKAEGLTAKSITGIIDNLTSHYSGDWDSALSSYIKKNKPGNRSKRVAADYIKKMKGR